MSATPTTRARSAPPETASHLHERPDVHPADEGQWLEPFDGDVGAERDAWRHREDVWYWDVER